MRILIATAGSRGDVEPFISFANRAQAAGHSVRLAIPDRSGADTTGLDAVSLEVDYSALIQDQGVSVLAALRSFNAVVKPIMRAVLVNSVKVALDFEPDVIVYHPKIISAPIAADRLGIPHIVVELVPALTPTSAFAAPGTVAASLGPLNRLTYGAAAVSARMFRTELAEARRIAGGASSSSKMSPSAASLVPISPSILPRPADWPPSVHLTGAWNDARPTGFTPEVEAFASEGDFVYVGFGSMAVGDPDARGRTVVEAARHHGSRLLVATGLGGISVPDDLRGDDLLVAKSIDHASILPRATCAIHHGGVGTVQAVARAGTTSIIVPFIADQPFWGAQMHRNALAPAPIPNRSLTTARLSRALDEADSYTTRNREVGVAMAREDGLGEALAVVEATSA